MHRKFEGNRPVRKKVMLFQRMDWNAIHDLPFSQAGRKTLAYNCQQCEDQNLDLFCCFKFVASFCKFLPPIIPHFTISIFIHTMASPFGVFNSCQYYVTNCPIVTQTAMFLLPLESAQEDLSNAHITFENKRILRLIEHVKTIKQSIMYRPLNLCYLPMLFITFCLHFTIKCYVDLTFLDIKSRLYLLFSSQRKAIQQMLFSSLLLRI